MDMPVEDILKVGGSSLGGAGLFTWLYRFLRGDIKRVEIAHSKGAQDQAKINADLYTKINEQNLALTKNELEASRTYVRQTDFEALRNHIDAQFIDQRDFFMKLIGKSPV